jgi:hypothetical protein
MKNTRKKHASQILARLRRGWKINRASAITEFSCWNLAARISELRKLGWDIKTVENPGDLADYVLAGLDRI